MTTFTITMYDADAPALIDVLNAAEEEGALTEAFTLQEQTARPLSPEAIRFTRFIMDQVDLNGADPEFAGLVNEVRAWAAVA